MVQNSGACWNPTLSGSIWVLEWYKNYSPIGRHSHWTLCVCSLITLHTTRNIYFTSAYHISVGTVTRYGLDGPGLKSQCGARFSAAFQTGPGANPTSCTMGTGSFPGQSSQGMSLNTHPPSSADVKERVQLYLCFTSGPSWPVLGWTLPLPLSTIVKHVLILSVLINICLHVNICMCKCARAHVCEWVSVCVCVGGGSKVSSGD